MKNFTRFASYFVEYAKAYNLGLTEDKGIPGPVFLETIKQSLTKCHIFEISDDVKKLLALTNCPNKNEQFKLPFPTIFLDVSFKKEEMKKLGIDIGYNEIIGIIVSEGYVLKETDNKNLEELLLTKTIDASLIDKYQDVKKIGKDLRITICSKPNTEEFLFDVFNVNVNILDEYKKYKNFKIKRIDTTNPYARKFIHLFVLNFLNFLYSPEVEYISIPPDEKRNAKRIAKNKIPIPERNIIKIKGVLKRYITELKQKSAWHYSYRFWVRGHFRILRDKDYWGDKVGTRIWIPPYQKGSGILIEKRYKIEKTEKVEETHV